MISPISSSLIGLQQANDKISKAAENISKLNTAQATTDDPTQDIVDLSVAAREFEANLQPIKVQQKLDQALFDILA